MFYERTYAEYSRVWGFVKVLLMCGDSVVVRTSTSSLELDLMGLDFLPDEHDGWMCER